MNTLIQKQKFLCTIAFIFILLLSFIDIRLANAQSTTDKKTSNVSKKDIHWLLYTDRLKFFELFGKKWHEATPKQRAKFLKYKKKKIAAQEKIDNKYDKKQKAVEKEIKRKQKERKRKQRQAKLKKERRERAEKKRIVKEKQELKKKKNMMMKKMRRNR